MMSAHHLHTTRFGRTQRVIAVFGVFIPTETYNVSRCKGGRTSVTSTQNKIFLRSYIMKYLKFINKFFAKHLLACNTVSSALIMTSGDVIIQKMTSPEKHDRDRMYKMGFVGATMGPMEHLFYKFLDSVFPMNDKRTVFKKIFLDQTLAAPIFICTFFFLTNLWEKKPKESVDEIKAKFLDVYKVDLLVWPAAQYINFVYLPPQLRVLYVSGISVVYTAFLSYIKHQVPVQE